MDIEIVKKYFNIDTKKICENTNLLRLRNWEICKIDYPFFIIMMQHPLSKKYYCIKFECNELPISMQVVDPQNYLPLPLTLWPQGGYFINGHSKTQGPFLCAPGIREYHTHSSHENETQCYAGSEFRLPSVLDIVYTHLLKANS